MSFAMVSVASWFAINLALVGDEIASSAPQWITAINGCAVGITGMTLIFAWLER